MSVDATQATWKLSKQQVTATEKLLLLTCADRASEQGICWPSIKRLSEDTCLDRKTIISVRQSVIDKNLIRYTGVNHGKQKQIPEMQLLYITNRSQDDDEFTSPEIGTDKNFTSPENGTRTSPENGTGNQSRKRDTEPKSLLNLKEEPVCGGNPPNPLHNTQDSFEKKAFGSQEACSLFENKFRGRSISYESLFEDCKSHYESKSKWVSESAWKKWIVRELPDNYEKKGSHQDKPANPNQNKIIEYNEHVARLKSDITLGLTPKDTKIPTPKEWGLC